MERFLLLLQFEKGKNLFITEEKNAIFISHKSTIFRTLSFFL